jgi:hypothetical protein
VSVRAVQRAWRPKAQLSPRGPWSHSRGRGDENRGPGGPGRISIRAAGCERRGCQRGAGRRGGARHRHRERGGRSSLTARVCAVADVRGAASRVTEFPAESGGARAHRHRAALPLPLKTPPPSEPSRLRGRPRSEPRTRIRPDGHGAPGSRRLGGRNPALGGARRTFADDRPRRRSAVREGTADVRRGLAARGRAGARPASVFAEMFDDDVAVQRELKTLDFEDPAPWTRRPPGSPPGPEASERGS